MYHRMGASQTQTPRFSGFADTDMPVLATKSSKPVILVKNTEMFDS